jgi:hypothetical protein
MRIVVRSPLLGRRLASTACAGIGAKHAGVGGGLRSVPGACPARRAFAPSTIVAGDRNYRLRLKDPFGAERLDRISLGTPATTGHRLHEPTDGLELPEKGRGGRAAGSVTAMYLRTR